jgi:two-component system, NtrC family, nitrogen regulation sensor histidine kinase NtrY
MVLNRFFISVFIRVILISISGVVLGIILQHLNHGYFYTLAGLIFLIFFQAYLLVNYVNKTNSDLDKFFSSVQDHDSSIRFTESKSDDSFRKLRVRMNHVNTLIQRVKLENEKSAQFLNSVVDHIDSGLLSIDLNGEIKIFNQAAKKYFNVLQPVKLSALGSTDEGLSAIVNSIQPGQEILHKVRIGNNSQSILVKATGLKTEESVIRLVSLQDITGELDKKEMDSWQKIIRVLTHEIMNSISPITSLTRVISGYFRQKDTGDPIPLKMINDQMVTKALTGLNTIEETGKGLLDFVDKFRSLSSLPEPSLSTFAIESLFRKCIILMGSDLSEDIEIIAEVSPDDMELKADYAMVEQVLINLIRNAGQALENRKNGRIHLNASYCDGGILIQVEDNGYGIPKEIAEDIFVPFFTTRKNGTGIGLSLSRQIMQNHNGSISVNSDPGKGSVFSLKFPV